jgi:hypothetical protein
MAVVEPVVHILSLERRVQTVWVVVEVEVVMARMVATVALVVSL